MCKNMLSRINVSDVDDIGHLFIFLNSVLSLKPISEWFDLIMPPQMMKALSFPAALVTNSFVELAIS